MKYECAFVYESGERDDFVIAPATTSAGAMVLEGYRPEGIEGAQSGQTPGVSLANTADCVMWAHGRRIAEVHAPAVVLAEALKHANRPQMMMSSYGFNGRVEWTPTRRSDFPALRRVPTGEPPAPSP